MGQRFLILGSLGMLGRAWRELLTAQGIPFAHGDRDEIDITDPASIDRALAGAQGAVVRPSAGEPRINEPVNRPSPGKPRYTHVVNCAAWTDVDAAETNEAGATLLNGTAVGLLAEACARHGSMLVHYSTDYVFDGQATAPYRTDQKRDPLNAYGRSKAAGEVALERWPAAPKASPQAPPTPPTPSAPWLCIRTSWLYAPWGKNFMRTIAAAALTRPQLNVVDDQRGRPTSAEHLSRVTLSMIEAGASGMHHVTDGGECTWFEFARHIVERLRRAPSQREGVGGGLSSSSSSSSSSSPARLARVDPCTSAEFPRPAKRPAYSVLDLSKTEALIGPMQDWRKNVEEAMRKREG